jgi:uncharacterized membrane protein
MIRWTLLLIGGVLLGGLVHLSTIIALPRTATQDAYSRLSQIASVNKAVRLPEPTPQKALMPYMDPAFAEAVCRYDLDRGLLKISVPISLAYTSVSFYTDHDIAYYAINDRAAGRHTIALELMTAEQHNDMPQDENITAADRLIVEAPAPTGLVVFRALAPEPGMMAMAQATVGSAKCEPAALPAASQ